VLELLGTGLGISIRDDGLLEIGRNGRIGDDGAQGLDGDFGKDGAVILDDGLEPSSKSRGLKDVGLTSLDGRDVLRVQDESVIDVRVVVESAPVDANVVLHVADGKRNLVLDPSLRLFVDEIAVENGSEVDGSSVGTLGDDVRSKHVDEVHVSCLVVLLGQESQLCLELSIQDLEVGPQVHLELGPSQSVFRKGNLRIVEQGIDLSLGMAEGKLEIDSSDLSTNADSPAGDVAVVVCLIAVHDGDPAVIDKGGSRVSKGSVGKEVLRASDLDGVVLVERKLVGRKGDLLGDNVVARTDADFPTDNAPDGILGPNGGKEEKC